MGNEMVLTEHARQRMALRHISQAEIDDVLRAYQVALPGHDGATNYYKVIGERRIRVTVAIDGKTILTVTEEKA